MRKTQSGFTLVEIAIVLVIIGLLLGGVLKGQELINSAKAKAAVNDFRNTLTMITAYQDRFRALPGDDPAPIAHLGATAVLASTGTTGNGRIDGNWDSSTAGDESVVMWQHLRLANLATGDVSAPGKDVSAWVPTNSDGGRIGVSATKPSGLGANVRGTQYICQAHINGRIAQQIDSTMDDGNPDAGSVGAFEEGTGSTSTPTSTTAYDTSKMYVVCYGF
ncbi:MAG: prepilin-type N-terminal cleavage/methylation domain-containing protein [Rhodocyclaceae bacterium]